MQQPDYAPVYLFGPTSIQTDDIFVSGSKKRAMERVNLMGFFSEAGYRVGLGLPKVPDYILDQGIRPFAVSAVEGYHRFEELAAFHVPGLEVYDVPLASRRMVEWPRDAFTTIGRQVFIGNDLGEVTDDVLGFIRKNVPSDYSVSVSVLGEGGKVVQCGNNLLVTEKIAATARKRLGIAGTNIVPVRPDKKLNSWRNRLTGQGSDHIDLVVSGINGAEGVLFPVDMGFSRSTNFSSELGSLQPARVLELVKDGPFLPNRIIQMHDGKVVIPPELSKGRDEIVSFVGRDQTLEPPVRFDPSVEHFLGSWRCCHVPLPLLPRE